MHDERDNLDPLIRLQPTGAAPVSAPRREQWPTADRAPQTGGLGRVVIPVVIVGGILLAVAAIAAAVGVIVRLGKESTKVVVVNGHRDPAALRAESTAVFGKFDAVEQARAELGAEMKQEREAIVALFDQIEHCAAEEKHIAFKGLVDFDRMLKRIELTGNMAGWSYFDKRSWKSQLKDSAETESYWADITVAGIVATDDDPDSRIVYAYCHDTSGANPAECRFWIARDGDTWKLYDWARLDLGFAESQKWGLYAKYADTPFISGFDRWGQLLGEVDAATSQGDRKTATEKLREAEAQPIPVEFQDFHMVLTGYRWAALDKLDEAQRCYERVSQPENTPGVYYGLLSCNQWKKPAHALTYAKSYEEAVGPSPPLLEMKAQLLKRLRRDEEAMIEWRRLLRIEPDHTSALSEFVSSLPLENESEFESQLEQLPDPVKSIVSIAADVGGEDYERLLLIAEYVSRKSPDSAAAHYVTGLTQFLDGQYAKAATLYRAAFEKEPDEETRDTYVDEYVDAMAADGKIAEALKNVPNALPMFETLYYEDDESELELTRDEMRQVVALHRKLFPDDLAGMHREASMAIYDERYAEAEPLLRKALETADDDEDSEYYRDSCRALLTTSLVKLDRWKEAYEKVGERRAQFVQIARMAANEQRWDVVRKLLETHRAADADDPQIHGVEGELAAHEKRWDDSVRHLRQGLQAAVDDDVWRMKHQLVETYVKSERWLDHFRTSTDQGEIFKQLASRFTEEENWDAMTKLIDEYRRIEPDDIRIVQQQAEIAWHKENYTLYSRLAQRLLNSDDENVMEYERYGLESRLMSALLRSRQFGEARQLAVAKQGDDNDVSRLAIVNAADGKLVEAQRLALETARGRKHAGVFYNNDETGPIFLGDEFSELHNEFPINVPYDAANTVAVFVFDKPQRLDEADVYASMKKLGIEIGVAAEPVTVTHAGSVDALALKKGGAKVWLAAGEGEFDKDWRLGNKQHALAGTLKNGAGWLAVGTAGLTEPSRELAEPMARRLGGELAGDRAALVCIRGPERWMNSVYPADAKLIAEWQASGNAKSFDEDAAPIIEGTEADVAANREFEQALREAVRGFEASSDGRLEVVCSVSKHPQIDPLRLQVKKVQRMYGSLTFDGLLLNDSALVPELRKGLPMQFHSALVEEVRLNDDEPVRHR